MQITMFDRNHIVEHPFEESHVFTQNRADDFSGATLRDRDETSSPIVFVKAADLSLEVPTVFERVRADYEAMRESLRSGGEPRSHMGALIQSRTKGAGHGSVSRAWYARTGFVNLLLGIGK
jgi:hypothetical protein